MCAKCGSRNHSSKMCSLFPFSKERCKICKLFHSTDKCNKRDKISSEALEIEEFNVDMIQVISDCEKVEQWKKKSAGDLFRYDRSESLEDEMKSPTTKVSTLVNNNRVPIKPLYECSSCFLCHFEEAESCASCSLCQPK